MTKPLPHTLTTQGISGESAKGGIWALSEDSLRCIDRSGPAIVLVPSEAVLTLAVPLPPLGNAVRRREALPFAIEDAIAEPLDQVHVALGEEQAPGVWLAGVVSRRVMRDWVEQLAEAGLARAAIVPDALCLPVPDTGNWSVAATADRVCVRIGDGSGFALPPAQFEAAWRAAGEPARITCEPLPGPALDLRQGAYARPRRPIDPLWRRVALIAGIGALAHGVIAIADTAALTHLVHVRQAHVRDIAAGMHPPIAIGADLGDTLNALAPDGAAAPSAFIPLMSRSAAAIGSGPSLWRSVAFDRAAGTLTIEVEATDIADLQRIAQALAHAGLNAQPGPATSESGHAIGSFVIRAS